MIKLLKRLFGGTKSRVVDAELEYLESEVNIPERDKALAKKFAAIALRSAGVVYHQATLLYLRETHKTVEDFDKLPLAVKEAYFIKARGL